MARVYVSMLSASSFFINTDFDVLVMALVMWQREGDTSARGKSGSQIKIICSSIKEQSNEDIICEAEFLYLLDFVRNSSFKASSVIFLIFRRLSTDSV